MFAKNSSEKDSALPFDHTESPIETAPIQPWWGEYAFEINQSKAWQFGSLLFRITRGLQEWRLEYYRPVVQYDYEQK